MSLAIIGAGMVSPAGLTPHAHACVLWASALPPTASPFVRESGEPVPVAYCPWLGARLGMGDRLLAMARGALDDALRCLQGTPAGEAASLLLCSAGDRPGLAPADRAELEQSLLHAAGAREVTRFEGAAGVFAALREAEALLANGAQAVTLLALDSYVGVDALAERVENPPSPWGATPAPPAEGAAALVVTTPAQARLLGLNALGVVHYADTATGVSNDDNDVPADGEAMAHLLRRSPGLGASARLVFGQFSVDSLRRTEWQLALARHPSLVHQEYEMRSIDAELGAVGVAAGAMNLVYGLAVVRHGTTEAPVRDVDPFLAWGISSDGTRGLALVSVTL
jgi:hypothetical protein